MITVCISKGDQGQWCADRATASIRPQPSLPPLPAAKLGWLRAGCGKPAAATAQQKPGAFS
jgi:hypothetical protein